MAKTNNLHIRIDPEIQRKADRVLRKLGISIPDAITIFLKQVDLKGGLPFDVTLPKDESKKYFYGMELPDMTYYAKEGFEHFYKNIPSPKFKAEYENWLNQAISTSREKLGNDWNEECFWSMVFKDDKNYGAFDSFSKLFEKFGLQLTYCYSNEQVHGIVPPCVLGVPLKLSEEKKVLNGQKPSVFVSLCRKLREINSQFDEKDLEVFEVFDEETEMMMGNLFDPNDSNFMSSDDY